MTQLFSGNVFKCPYFLLVPKVYNVQQNVKRSLIACVNNSLFSNYSHTFQISFAFNQDNYHMLGGLTICHGCLPDNSRTQSYKCVSTKKCLFHYIFIILTFPIKYKIQSKCHFPLKDLSEKNNFMLHISYSGNSVFHLILQFIFFLLILNND